MRAARSLLAVAAWIEAHCHVLYVALAVPAAVWLAICIPPFQSPDEFAHFYRADQISRGGIFGVRFGEDESGGLVDAALPQAMAPYTSIPFRLDATLTAAQVDATRGIRWSGESVWVSFRNTVNYGPLCYVPQVFGIWMGRLAGVGVIDSFVLARVANGLLACLVSGLALRLCVRGRAVMFTVLMWPMTLSLYGSSSHDALLIATALLVIATASRAVAEGRPASPLAFFAAVAAITAGVTGRPPHAAFFLLLPLLVSWRATPTQARFSPTQGVILLAAAAVCVGWVLAVQANSMAASLNPRGDVSLSRQWDFLMNHPGAVVPLAYRSVVIGWKSVITTAIGVLGWLDTLLPEAYYKLACVVFLLALAADSHGHGPKRLRGALWAGATLGTFVVFTYAAIYLTWTRVGATEILGVQGRYLLAGVPLVAWLSPPWFGGHPTGQVLRSLAWVCTALFPLVTFAIVHAAILTRYYAP